MSSAFHSILSIVISHPGIGTSLNNIALPTLASLPVASLIHENIDPQLTVPTIIDLSLTKDVALKRSIHDFP